MLGRDASIILRSHCEPTYHTDGGRISQNPKQTRALPQTWPLICNIDTLYWDEVLDYEVSDDMTYAVGSTMI